MNPVSGNVFIGAIPTESEHHCTCSQFEPPCQAAITQEDLLCNTCRCGCDGTAPIGLTHLRRVGVLGEIN